MSTRPSWPWSTTVLVAASIVVYVATGATPDYQLDDSGAGMNRPSITDLTFDVFRHPSTAAMVITLVFLVPVGFAAERALHAVAVGATYIVAGFAAGLVEVLVVQGTAAVVGGYGATTGVIALWCVTRWRQHHDAVMPVAVTAAWVLLGSHLYAGMPWFGVAAAAFVGLYALDAVPFRGSARHPGTGADPP